MDGKSCLQKVLKWWASIVHREASEIALKRHILVTGNVGLSHLYFKIILGKFGSLLSLFPAGLSNGSLIMWPEYIYLWSSFYQNIYSLMATKKEIVIDTIGKLGNIYWFIEFEEQVLFKVNYFFLKFHSRSTKLIWSQRA